MIVQLKSWVGQPSSGAVLLASAPLLVLTLPGWSNAILFIGALFSALVLAVGRLDAAALSEGDRRYARVLLIALSAPLAAAGLSALLRQDGYPGQFDAPSRFLLAVPIFLYVLRSRAGVLQWLQRLLPLAVLVPLVVLEVFGRDQKWPAGRETTAAVDPLVFGYLSLAFGLMCLVTLPGRRVKPGEWPGVLWRVTGMAAGIYLSVRSGSRTGWAAFPVVVGLWLYWHWGRGYPWRTLAVLTATAAIPVAAYLLLPAVQARVQEGWQEIAQYTWSGIAPYTSVGLRITYLRMASELFAMHPWQGLGDTSRIPLTALPAFSYTSPEALKIAYGSAFHNQVVSSAVRSGVGGLVAAALLMLVPLAICVRGIRQQGSRESADAAMGVAFFTCLLVSSLSTEVVDLKFMASFYAVMAAVFCGALLNRHGQE